MLHVLRMACCGVVALAMLGLAGCVTGNVTSGGSGHRSEAAAAMRAAGGSSGFVCGPTVDGDFVCLCWEADSDPLFSCEGMSKFCDVFDHGDLCSPTGTCNCRIKVPARNP